jgi:alpha-galactosidase
MSKLSIRSAVARTLAMALCFAPISAAQRLTNRSLAVTVEAQNGSFQIAAQSNPGHPVLNARPGAQIDGQWLRSSDYPQRRAAESTFQDALGAGRQISVTCSGLAGKPDFVLHPPAL